MTDGKRQAIFMKYHGHCAYCGHAKSGDFPVLGFGNVKNTYIRKLPPVKDGSPYYRVGYQPPL